METQTLFQTTPAPSESLAVVPGTGICSKWPTLIIEIINFLHVNWISVIRFILVFIIFSMYAKHTACGPNTGLVGVQYFPFDECWEWKNAHFLLVMFCQKNFPIYLY